MWETTALLFGLSLLNYIGVTDAASLLNTLLPTCRTKFCYPEGTPKLGYCITCNTKASPPTFTVNTTATCGP